jgi:hypothetical protein
MPQVVVQKNTLTATLRFRSVSIHQRAAISLPSAAATGLSDSCHLRRRSSQQLSAMPQGCVDAMDAMPMYKTTPTSFHLEYPLSFLPHSCRSCVSPPGFYYSSALQYPEHSSSCPLVSQYLVNPQLLPSNRLRFFWLPMAQHPCSEGWTFFVLSSLKLQTTFFGLVQCNTFGHLRAPGLTSPLPPALLFA